MNSIIDNMIIDIDEYCQYLMKHNITPNQFLLCFLLYSDAYDTLPSGKRLYHKKSNENHPIANMYKMIEHWKKQNKVIWNKSDLDYLEKTGFIEVLNPTIPKQYIPDTYKITIKYIDSLFATLTEFEQFYELYPTWITNFSGPHLPKINLKMVDKEELQTLFNKKILTKLVFDRMMIALNWAVQNNQINMNIQKYLTSEIWKEHQKLAEEYNGSETPNFLRRSS